MRIALLSIGARGDAQPLVALGLGLKNAGYEVVIASHLHNKDLIQNYGLEFSPVKFDFKKFLHGKGGQAVLDPKGNSLRSLTGLARLVRAIQPGVEEMLFDSLNASKGADAVITAAINPGYHIAEKLGVPCFLVELYPFSPTGDFPPPVIPSKYDLGKTLNRLTYTIVEQLTWLAFKKNVNKWRKKLDLSAVKFINHFSYVRKKKIPHLNAYSRFVVPEPKDWPKRMHTTGYWFLDKPKGWQPTKELADFIENGSSPISIGFGSMTDKNNEKLATILVEALEKTGQRGILLSGWGGLGNKNLPKTILRMDAVPHDWLFPKMKAIIHHGGAGTTGAALRSGIPSIAIPFFGDQFFWGKQIQKIGVGPKPLPIKNLTSENLSKAINQMLTNETMRSKAKKVGRKIREEDGVGNAVRAINRYLKG